jgi:hypothetical protein
MGVGYAAGTTTAKINSVLLAGAILISSLGTTGAVLLDTSSERGFIRWNEVRTIRINPNERFIFVRPRWLIHLIRLYCTAENFLIVLVFVHRHQKNLRLGEIVLTRIFPPILHTSIKLLLPRG